MISTRKLLYQTIEELNLLKQSMAKLRVFHGTCSTDSTVFPKVVECPDYSDPKAGDIVIVTYTAGWEAPAYGGDFKININGTGAKTVHAYGDGGGYIPTGHWRGASESSIYIYDGLGNWTDITVYAYRVATSTRNGLMSAADKTKLDNI